MSVQLDAIRECLEGVIPGTMATAGPDGMPNVAYLSQVQYVDSRHVALSWQFFNKTRQNILGDPRASLVVVSPSTLQQYRLKLEYLHTETSGPLFENMKARLAGIASHTGMSGVFRLLGADIFRVHEVEALPGAVTPAQLSSAICWPRCAPPVPGWPDATTWTACWPKRSPASIRSSASAMRCC